MQTLFPVACRASRAVFAATRLLASPPKACHERRLYSLERSTGGSKRSMAGHSIFSASRILVCRVGFKAGRVFRATSALSRLSTTQSLDRTCESLFEIFGGKIASVRALDRSALFMGGIAYDGIRADVASSSRIEPQKYRAHF